MLFFLFINVKMSTIVGILIFMSRKNFMLSWVEHEKSFITSGPGYTIVHKYPDLQHGLPRNVHGHQRMYLFSYFAQTIKIFPKPQWVATWQNQQCGIYAQQRLGSLWASAKPEQCLYCQHGGVSLATQAYRRLIGVFAWRKCHFVHFVMLRLK